MGIKFEFLQAGDGDCILISVDDNDFNILIDGGYKNTYGNKNIFNLKDKIQTDIRDKEKFLDLVVMTHYDMDHIGGIIKLLEEEEKKLDKGKETIIKNIWFNTFKNALVEIEGNTSETAAKEQIQFDEFLTSIIKKTKNNNSRIVYNSRISIDDIKDPVFFGNSNEIELILLSPNDKKLKALYERDFEPYLEDMKINKSDYSYICEELKSVESAEDGSDRNGSSIAFILIYENMKFLFLGDAHIGLVVESLKNLDKEYFNEDGFIEFEFVKLSHHGSSKNISVSFLDLISTDKYIVTTSGVSFGHPDRETIEEIVSHNNREKLDNGEYKNKIEFFSNYDYEGRVLSVSEQRKYKAPFKFLLRDIYEPIKSKLNVNLEYEVI